ncbi:Opi10 protein [Saccharomycopsis crataegensis]|uniref:Opi10 protein n=1 Tax=Saccharomycopsis crataegensis TaxID=43959 RepID=A0AAV5QVL8_9ASCO|nr:Opi10 protein [Saccharomycopsis crataegensis]
MFGLVCSGRPVAIAQQVENLKFVFNVDNSANISHVSLFILPDTPFDPNYTALIYFQLPNSSSSDFKLLGKLSVDKPSAIFKIKNSAATKQPAILNTPFAQIDDDMMVDDDNSTNNQGATIHSLDEDTLVIGISIEPTPQAEDLLAQEKAQQQQQQSQEKTITGGSYSGPTAGELASRDLEGTAMLANKIVSNAYNYLSGFVDDNNKVSMKVLDGWWSKFQTKLQNDPKFLDN